MAQLEGGVVEQVAERLTKSGEARAGGRLFGIFDLGGSLMREKSAEQTKSLQDALFLLFEGAAEEAGTLAERAFLHDVHAWEDGKVHGALKPGQILRVNAPTRILDSRHFRERAERFSRWPRLITSFAHHESLAAAKNPKERERRLGQLVAKELGGEPVLDLIRDLGEFVELFMAGMVVLRQFPCGVDRPEYAIVGSLLDRPGFLQEERDALFGKYGSNPSDWVHVFQVASVPKQDGGSPDINGVGLVDSASGQISRDKFEDLCIRMMRVMESTGIAEAPTYPSISVTPLALYREIPAQSA